jgi:hypothetical protein
MHQHEDKATGGMAVGTQALHLLISGRVKLWRIAMSSSFRTLTVSGTRFSRLTIESVTTCRHHRQCLHLHSDMMC